TRTQAREDGVQFAQIVRSPATSPRGPPGPATPHHPIGAKPGVPLSTPYFRSAGPNPGVVEVENFDAGGEGVAYHDDGPGNAGGQYRQTDVDIAADANNTGYVVGWVSAGEWLNYSVNVTTAGSYTIGVRVACYGQGGTFHIESNGTNVTGTLTVPDTGGSQDWQTLNTTATFPARPQILRLVIDTPRL